MRIKSASKEELYKLYQEQEYTFTEIAEMFNCVPKTIGNKLKNFGIKIRSMKEAVNTKRFKKIHNGYNVGKNNPSWKGGQTIDVQGYIHILMPEHPRANSRGYVHRSHLVAEEILGRYLYFWEITHHKNSIKHDDRSENIEILSSIGKHNSVHKKMRERGR